MNIDEFKNLAVKVADKLGSFRVDFPENQGASRFRCTMTDLQTGLTFSFVYEVFVLNANDKGRLLVLSKYPRNYRNEANYSEDSQIKISLSPAKTPEQIARNIHKRFFPKYKERFERIVALNQDQLDGHNNMMVNLQNVADAIGGKVVARSYDQDSYYIETPEELRSQGLYAIHPFGVDFVKFELRLTGDDAVKLTEFLKTL